MSTKLLDSRPPPNGFMSVSEWEARAHAHEARLVAVVEPHLTRQARGEKHPVMDFLFEYYPHRPSALMRWSPGWTWGVALGERPHPFGPAGVASEAGAWLCPSRWPVKRLSGMRWIRQLLRATQGRAGKLDCLGLHEWAMVYEQADVRHPGLALRLPHAEIRRLVEELPVQCTHYDAFRFFSASARPLNRWQPRSDDRFDHEQPACLHSNMDLYKWAFKFSPWVDSDLVADCFLLAVDIRALDMEASPYDVRPLGYGAVCIETPEGRAEYVQRQAALAERARPLRERLIGAYEALWAAVEELSGASDHPDGIKGFTETSEQTRVSS